MKKLILFLGIIISSTLVNAQGNLQFNQVVSETVSVSGNYSNWFGTFSGSTFSSNYKVPEGKVWKVVALSYASSSAHNSYWPSNCMRINGVSAITTGFSIGGTLNENPIWLKANDELSVGIIDAPNYGGSRDINPYGASFHISIIEFNIIP